MTSPSLRPQVLGNPRNEIATYSNSPAVSPTKGIGSKALLTGGRPRTPGAAATPPPGGGATSSASPAPRSKQGLPNQLRRRNSRPRAGARGPNPGVEGVGVVSDSSDNGNDLSGNALSSEVASFQRVSTYRQRRNEAVAKQKYKESISYARRRETAVAQAMARAESTNEQPKFMSYSEHRKALSYAARRGRNRALAEAEEEQAGSRSQVAAVPQQAWPQAIEPGSTRPSQPAASPASDLRGHSAQKKPLLSPSSNVVSGAGGANDRCRSASASRASPSPRGGSGFANSRDPQATPLLRPPSADGDSHPGRRAPSPRGSSRGVAIASRGGSRAHAMQQPPMMRLDEPGPLAI
eukprot:TRINITY_DN56221_c0_g1_i1.p1 TRINITY_DN56221_c0_g1~~TRINITY_DN56221_c0_g1_i1.p1  ORF type:complete len:351 (+),score=37.40 TRINITY_DN56221_c0_g1_i1:225-1277(+)